jgi:hypothetical protein
MADWNDFRTQAPELAQLAEARFAETGVAVIGTLRRDGWPRLTPVEPFVHDGRLYLGMMWQSLKALDLLRDPRVTVHSAVTGKDGKGGDVKLYGVATAVEDAGDRGRYAAAFKEATGYFPEGDFHLFAVDLVQAGSAWVEGDQMVTTRWRPGSAPATARRAG